MASTIEVEARKLVDRLTEFAPASIPTSQLDALIAAVNAADDTPHAELYRDAAEFEYGEGGRIEIDSDATVSISSDGGAYVQAWVFVYDDQVEGLPEED